VLDNETVWLIRAQKGDTGAFSRLVEHYQRSVYNLCCRMLGDGQDAEDAAQESFLRAYKGLKRFDLQRSFSSWLLSIAAHYCIDQLRKKRFNIVSTEDLLVPDLPDRSPHVESVLCQEEENMQIRMLLNVLTPTDRAAVILYYWYDYSYQAIAQTLNLSNSAVKSRLHRARRTMARSWMKRQTQSFNAERMPI
jgi:RNA polymerase sigma-70 factor (ECF subfamily)